MDPKLEVDSANVDEALDLELRAIWTQPPAASPQLRTKLLAQIEGDAEVQAPATAARTFRGPMHASRPKKGLATAWAAGAAAALVLVGVRFAVRAHRQDVQRYEAATELTEEDEKFALGVSMVDDDEEDSPSFLDVAEQE